jgi:hypothetical protein
LIVKIMATGLNLLVIWITVLRWAALDNIRDEYIISFETDICEEAIENSSRPAHKGDTFEILTSAGRLTNEENTGRNRALSRNGVGSCLCKRAAGAGAYGLI